MSRLQQVDVNCPYVKSLLILDTWTSKFARWSSAWSPCNLSSWTPPTSGTPPKKIRVDQWFYPKNETKASHCRSTASSLSSSWHWTVCVCRAVCKASHSSGASCLGSTLNLCFIFETKGSKTYHSNSITLFDLHCQEASFPGNFLYRNHPWQEISITGNFPFQELSFTGIILYRNYPLQESSFTGTFLYRNHPF